jgi:hypothetical protein
MSLLLLATVIMIVNYYGTVIPVITYDRKTFIVQATVCPNVSLKNTLTYVLVSQP